MIGHGGALIPLPGSAEGGLVGMYTAYGASLSLSVGAILVYRTFHAGLPVVLGLLGYADIRRLRQHAQSRGDRSALHAPLTAWATAQRVRPRRWAAAASSPRLRTESLPRMRETWTLAVLSLM